MKRPFSLSPRLAAVAELVPPGTRLADVGTDHGRLPVWLIQHGVVDRAVASDLRPGPLSRARALAERWAVADRISFRLCDGLSGIRAEEAQTVTVAGMGGETISDILAAVPWSGQPGHRYIVQPMSGLDGLRRYLSGHGFAIRRETLVEEGRTLYVVLLAEPGEMPPLTVGEIWVGRQSKEQDSPLREKYLEQELGKLRRAAEGLSHAERAEDQAKRIWYETAAQGVERMREEWQRWQS